MASMTIRNLDDGLKKRLRIRAAAHGRSMEDEARDIFRAALSTGENRPANLAAAIRSRIVPFGGVELELPPRGHPRPTGFLRVIILDTNVLPELLAPAPSVAVETWLAEQQTAAEFTTTVTEAELFYGLRLMPDGRRRQELEAAIVPIFREDLAGRILPFGSEAADAFGCIAARRRKLGADQPVRRTNCRDRLVSWCLRGLPAMSRISLTPV